MWIESVLMMIFIKASVIICGNELGHHLLDNRTVCMAALTKQSQQGDNLTNNSEFLGCLKLKLQFCQTGDGEFGLCVKIGFPSHNPSHLVGPVNQAAGPWSFITVLVCLIDH